MKKLLLLLSLTLLTLSCSTDETTQRDENCYNSEVAYPQISLLPTWQGEFYRHINGVEILPRLVNTSNSITVYLENGEVRTYCKAVQMAQPYLGGANEPDSNNLRLTTTDYFRINRTSTNGYDISISSTEGDLINYAFAKR